MTRVIVHVGPHKTGTTYIQQTLSALHNVLQEHGIYVPSIWDAAPGLPSHMKLAWAIRNRDVTLVQNQANEMLARGYKAVVISCEALSRFDPEHILQLRQLLRADQVEIVHYVRRASERLPSLWQENVKHGHYMTIEEFIALELRQNDLFAAWETSVLDRYSAVFSPSQIKVVAYSHLVDNGVDIAGHFLTSFLDLRGIGLPDLGRPNGSLPAWTIELIRALNAIHSRRGGERSAAPRDWFLAHQDDLIPEGLVDTMRQHTSAIRLDERQPPLLLPSRQVLTRYEGSLIPPWDKDTLHDLRVTEVPFIRQDYLSEPGVATLLQDIHEMYRRTLRNNRA